MRPEPIPRNRSQDRPAIRGVVLACLVIGFIGCNAEPARQPSSSASDVARYELKGKIVSIDKSAKQLTVDHKAIPGFMGAMTMAYPVQDARTLESRSAGDQINAKVVSGNSSYWLEEIAVTNSSPAPFSK